MERRKRRQLERTWRKTRLTVHREMYKHQRTIVTNLISEAKMNCYQKRILDNSGDQKALSKIINNLISRKQISPLPPHNHPRELANNFSEYFINKIKKIQCELSAIEQTRNIDTDMEENKSETKFPCFKPATKSDVKKIIMASTAKSCQCDPIPTRILKECIQEISPMITQIINRSVLSGTVSERMKNNLDLILKNFRPVSNLTFISKTLERFVASQINHHLHVNLLTETFQSAYKERHSTETALLQVQNDILLAMDDDEITILVLLDLSAAFDTVDHSILIKRLEQRFGITDVALNWFKSYLSDRKQVVTINGETSNSQQLSCGVPQGSVLGPILFTMYTAHLGDIIRKHQIKFHLYADDTQLYISFKPRNQATAENALQRLSACISDIKVWLNMNKLKLNDDKTEVLVIGRKKQIAKVSITSLRIGSSDVNITKSARNIGVIQDSNLSK